MPYVNLENNKIIAVFANKQYENQLFVEESSAEYQEYLEEINKIEQKQILQIELNNLDIKRIRAIAEPSIKNEQTGQTWLEYYTDEITILRNQIQEL